jgi:hypothetical protein
MVALRNSNALVSTVLVSATLAVVTPTAGAGPSERSAEERPDEERGPDLGGHLASAAGTPGAARRADPT